MTEDDWNHAESGVQQHIFRIERELREARAKLDAATVREEALRSALEALLGLASPAMYAELTVHHPERKALAEKAVAKLVRDAYSLDPAPSVRFLVAARKWADAWWIAIGDGENDGAEKTQAQVEDDEVRLAREASAARRAEKETKP